MKSNEIEDNRTICNRACYLRAIAESAIHAPRSSVDMKKLLLIG